MRQIPQALLGPVLTLYPTGADQDRVVPKETQKAKAYATIFQPVTTCTCAAITVL